MKGLLVLILLTLAAAAEAPRGWELFSSSPEIYSAAPDRSLAAKGSASGCLRSSKAVDAKNYAILLQGVDAARYRGRRLRMQAMLRTLDVSGWAGMMLRVDPRQGPPLAFDNMQDRPVKGTTSWTRCTIELNVPAAADSVHFGVVLAGSGTVWFDDVSLEPLGEAIPGMAERQKVRSLPLAPLNLDFEL